MSARIGPPVLSVRNLVKRYALGGGLFSRAAGVVHAVEDVSFDIARGETLGLVGESGSGKSTIGRLVMRLERPDAGRILLGGDDITALSERRLRPLRPRVQMVFQDPYSSLDPRYTTEQLIAEPLVIQGRGNAAERAARVGELLDMVGLPASARSKYPNEFSGGQRQRIGIARAIALRPELLVADEPVSALDVSIQAQVVNLLSDLQRDLGLSYLFIAHDLAVVKQISHRIAVLYLGRVMEIADSDTLYARPRHPYTLTLLSAAPEPDPELEARRRPLPIRGEIPSAVNPPPGCVFSTRCPLATEACRAEVPPLREVAPGHHVACLHLDRAAAMAGAALVLPGDVSLRR
jgi:peptide/nickel transport system ATP-binding protein